MDSYVLIFLFPFSKRALSLSWVPLAYERDVAYNGHTHTYLKIV
jgi:hypothetical protein